MHMASMVVAFRKANSWHNSKLSTAFQGNQYMSNRGGRQGYPRYLVSVDQDSK